MLNRSFVVRRGFILILLALLCRPISPLFAELWTTGYYPGFQQGVMPASNLDFTALSHVVHFSLIPNYDGSINSDTHGITPEGTADLITRAHAAGAKVLICVGGAESQTGFQGATSRENLSKFIRNVINFMGTNGYDGVDVDWEPMPVTDAGQFTSLINGLRDSLNHSATHKLLTVAMAAYPVYGDPAASEATMCASLQTKLDQINLMTYDMSGPYDGWITWFNSPLYDGGTAFPSNGNLLPSVDGAVTTFMTNGVAPAKLGIGIAFYGYVWSGGNGGTVPLQGVNRPRQSWTNAPAVSTAAYSQIMSNYYQSNQYFWDTNSQSAYLSVSNGGNRFVSYDDQHSCQAKVTYARKRGLGGMIIWELSQDYFPRQPAGQRMPLLEAVKQAVSGTSLTSLQLLDRDAPPHSDTAPAARFQFQPTNEVSIGATNELSSMRPLKK